MEQSFIKEREIKMTNSLTSYNINSQVVSRSADQEFLKTFECGNNIGAIQLNESEQKAIVITFNNGMHQMAAEMTWIRTISVLRDRLAFFGEEFIGDMLGYDKPVYADDLTEVEAINLNYDVGFFKPLVRIPGRTV